MGKSTSKQVKEPVHQCGMPACGVNKTYQQITQNWGSWAARQGLPEGQIRQVDAYWRRLGKLAKAGRL